jgi:hypothetical protein
VEEDWFLHVAKDEAWWWFMWSHELLSRTALTKSYVTYSATLAAAQATKFVSFNSRKLFFSSTTTDLCPVVPSALCLQSCCKVDC